MKGIIAEIHGSYMIVITKNGDFIKCKKLPNCNIGDEVNIPTRNISSIYKKLSTIAASFIILAMLSTGVYAYYTPYSYVSVDINPSLELYVNRFDKVIGVYAYNEDAKNLIDNSADLKNKGIDIALSQIIDSAADKGYIKENTQNSVMIVVSSNNEKEEAALSKMLSKTSETAMSKVGQSYEVILERTKVESFKEAKKENVSPGKVILANELKEVKPEVNEEEIKHMPLQQAIKEIEKKDEASINSTEEVRKPGVKQRAKNNVMNVQELIKEKNEELGKKIEENKNKAKDKHKENQGDKNDDKGSNRSKDNNQDKDNENNINKDQSQKDTRDNDRENDNNNDRNNDRNNDSERRESDNKRDSKETKKDGQDKEPSRDKDKK